MDKILKLPQNADGKFLLTKEAVNVIRKASYITLRYQKGKKTESFLRIVIESGEANAVFSMPVNVLFLGDYLLGTIACADKHPIQVLVKENTELIFSTEQYPIDKLVFELIHFTIKVREDVYIKGIFTTKISKHDSLHKMIQ